MLDSTPKTRPLAPSPPSDAPVLGYASRSSGSRRVRFSFAALGVVMAVASAMAGMVYGAGWGNPVGILSIIGVLVGAMCYCIARIMSPQRRPFWMKLAMIVVVEVSIIGLLATLDWELKFYPLLEAVEKWYRWTSAAQLLWLGGSVGAFASLRCIDWWISRSR